MRTMYLSLFTAGCFFAAVTPAAAETSLHFELNVKKAEADSLQKKADSLENEASKLDARLDNIEDDEEVREDIEDAIDDLKEKIEDLQDKIEEANGELRDAVDDAKDKVDDLNENRKEALEDIKESRKEALEDIDEAATERRKIGSFIIAFEYSHLDMGPLKDLVHDDKSLRGARDKFDFSNNRMMMFGLMGYYNMENNVRVGNGIYAGYKLFQSDDYQGSYYDSLLRATVAVDSMVTLRVIPAYIGFICEKAFIYEPMNFFAGIMLGGGMSIVVKEEQLSDNASSFLGEEDNDDDESRFSVALAPALAWDVHGGVAVRLSNRLHLGIDGVLRCAYAYEGYGAGFGDFVSVSPGVRFRLTFGSAG